MLRVHSILTHMSRNFCSSSKSDILTKETGCVGQVLLNRPDKLNALSLEMVRTLSPIYEKWCTEDSPVSCVFMHGTGKAFCAGGDVAEIREQVLTGGALPHEFFYEEYQLNHQIATAFERKGLVQVSVWDGVTMGGGVGLSLHGKVRVATEKTLFAMPECGIGFFPDVGGTYALGRLSGHSLALGCYIALTGCRLNAADCLFANLATHYVNSCDVELLRSDLEKVQDATGVYAVLDRVKGNVHAKGDIAGNIEVINQCFNGSSIADVLLKLSEVESDWARKTLKTLQSKSPTALNVTLEALHRHSKENVSIGSALKNEYRIRQRFMVKEGDFVEGIRAVLVDKDQNPRWNKAAQTDSFFKPLDEQHSKGELLL